MCFDDATEDDGKQDEEEEEKEEFVARGNARRPVTADTTRPKPQMNAFFQALSHANWRNWYGRVDQDDILDPPLRHAPQDLVQLVNQEDALALTTPTSAGVEVQDLTKTKKSKKKAQETQLDLLEAEIQQEKLRKQAFDAQLMLALAGKTLAGHDIVDLYLNTRRQP